MDLADDNAIYTINEDRAFFDSRVFILPKEEVCNYFIWRQQDATRNSIQMVAQSLYSHKELQNKNTIQLQDMMMNKEVNWNDYPTVQKRGYCYYKNFDRLDIHNRPTWTSDKEMPILTQDRNYIEKFMLGD